MLARHILKEHFSTVLADIIIVVIAHKSDGFTVTETYLNAVARTVEHIAVVHIARIGGERLCGGKCYRGNTDFCMHFEFFIAHLVFIIIAHAEGVSLPAL